MPPKKTAVPATRKTMRTKTSTGLSQPTLAFQSQRKSSLPKPKPALVPRSSTSLPEIAEIDTASTSDIAPDDDSSGVWGAEAPAKARGKRKRDAASGVSRGARTEEGRTGEGTGKKRQLDVKSKAWAGVLEAAKAAMGHLEPVHAGPGTQDDVHHILRVFDLSTRYGPCVGLSRLQRWERARAWGLHPPEEIRAILCTQQGQEDASYRENVLAPWL